MSDVIQYMLGVIAFFAVYTLNGIKSEIKDMKDSLRGLETELRGGVSSLDRRVTNLEASCRFAHCRHGDDHDAV